MLGTSVLPIVGTVRASRAPFGTVAKSQIAHTGFTRVLLRTYPRPDDVLVAWPEVNVAFGNDNLRSLMDAAAGIAAFRAYRLMSGTGREVTHSFLG